MTEKEQAAHDDAKNSPQSSTNSTKQQRSDMTRETMPNWLDALDDKLVTVKLHGDRIGRGTLYLFGSEFGNHMVDLWNVTLIIDTERSELTLEGTDTLCINAKTT